MPFPENLQALSPDMLVSIRLCLVLLLMVHLPVLGAILGGSALALLLNQIGRNERNPLYLRFSRELLGAVTFDWKILLPFVLLPVPFVGLVYELILSTSAVLPWAFWFVPAGGLIAAVFLLRIFHGALAEAAEAPGNRFSAGVAGALTGTAAFFLFWTVFGTVFNPEKLPLLGNRIVFLLSWNSIAKFLLVLALFLGITGTVMLRFVLRPEGKNEEQVPEYRTVVRSWGRSLVLLSSIGIPLFALLDLASLPELALSPSVVAWSLFLPLLMLAIVMTLLLSGERVEGAGARVPLLYALVVVVLLTGDQAAIGNVYRGRIAAAPGASAEPHEEAAGKERSAAAPAAAEEKGKAVFETVCSGCHSFEERVVGPPLGTVLPKYAGTPDALKGFLRNPGKVDPEYPKMPNLGLAEEEIDAVAGYLLGRIGTPGGTRTDGDDTDRSRKNE